MLSKVLESVEVCTVNVLCVFKCYVHDVYIYMCLCLCNYTHDIPAAVAALVEEAGSAVRLGPGLGPA